MEWGDSDAKEIVNGEKVQLRSFSTTNHRVDTLVSYRYVLDTWGYQDLHSDFMRQTCGLKCPDMDNSIFQQRSAFSASGISLKNRQRQSWAMEYIVSDHVRDPADIVD